MPCRVHGALVVICVLYSLSVSNTRFIAAVIERHTHTPERRRRYWGRSGTESDHGETRTEKHDRVAAFTAQAGDFLSVR